MPDLNDIKAGEYELVAELFDQALSKPGEPFRYKRHRKGDLVTLDAAEARRLYAAGAVVVPGDRERAALEAARVQYAAVEARLPANQRR